MATTAGRFFHIYIFPSLVDFQAYYVSQTLGGPFSRIVSTMWRRDILCGVPSGHAKAGREACLTLVYAERLQVEGGAGKRPRH